MRPVSYEQAWVLSGHQAVRKPQSSPADSDKLYFGIEEADRGYLGAATAQFLEGGAAPSSLQSGRKDGSTPRKVHSRSAKAYADRHDDEKVNLMQYAKQHLSTVRTALQAYSPSVVLSMHSSGMGSTSARSSAANNAGYLTYGSTGYAAHASKCTCASCIARAAARADILHTLSHSGDLMAMQGHRLHHAVRERAEPYDTLDSDDHTAFAYQQHAVPQAYYDERSQLASYSEDSDESDTERVPLYVQRRYSEASGVRERVVGKMTSTVLSPVPKNQSGVSKQPFKGARYTPLALERMHDPRVAALVSSLEMGEGVVGSRSSTAARLCAEVSARVQSAREERDHPMLSSSDDDEDEAGAANKAALRRRRTHDAVISRVLHSLAGSPIASPAALGRADKVMGGSPRKSLAGSVKSALKRHSGSLQGNASLASPAVRLVQGTGTCRVPGAMQKEPTGVWSDDSEDEYAVRASSAGASARRRSTAGNLGHTLQTLSYSGASLHEPATPESAQSHRPSSAWSARPSAGASSAQRRRITFDDDMASAAGPEPKTPVTPSRRRSSVAGLLHANRPQSASAGSMPGSPMGRAPTASGSAVRLSHAGLHVDVSSPRLASRSTAGGTPPRDSVAGTGFSAGERRLLSAAGRQAGLYDPDGMEHLSTWAVVGSQGGYAQVLDLDLQGHAEQAAAVRPARLRQVSVPDASALRSPSRAGDSDEWQYRVYRSVSRPGTPF